MKSLVKIFRTRPKVILLLLCVPLCLQIYKYLTTVSHQKASIIPAEPDTLKDGQEKVVRLVKEVYHERTYVCHVLGGGIGNVMFQIASMYGIARENNKQMVLKCDYMAYLNATFEIQGSFLTDMRLCHNPQILRQKRCCTFDNQLLKLKDGVNYVVDNYLQSHNYFDKYSDDIRAIFSFKPDVLQKAKAKLHAGLEEIGAQIPYTLIGVHIRRGDILKKVNADMGFKPVTSEYLKKARKYMDSEFNFGRVIYVVCSNDIKWAKTNFGDIGNELYMENNKENVDLAILSHTDHMILSSGTFSWWAGWFSHGTVVYWKHFYVEGSQLSKEYSADKKDHFLPEWVAL